MFKFSIFCLFFLQVTKQKLEKKFEYSRKFYLVEMIFQMIYLFIWQTFFEPCYQGMFFFG